MKAVIGVALLLWGLFLAVTSMQYTCEPIYQDTIGSQCLEKQGHLGFAAILALIGILLIVADVVSTNSKKNAPEEG